MRAGGRGEYDFWVSLEDFISLTAVPIAMKIPPIMVKNGKSSDRMKPVISSAMQIMVMNRNSFTIAAPQSNGSRS